jgi:hypothetical protein
MLVFEIIDSVQHFYPIQGKKILEEIFKILFSIDLRKEELQTILGQGISNAIS